MTGGCVKSDLYLAFVLATWAQRRGVPCVVLLAGSSTEYGRTADTLHGAALDEGAPLEPVTVYGVSKLACEKLAHVYHLAYNVSVLTARFFIQVRAEWAEVAGLWMPSRM